MLDVAVGRLFAIAAAVASCSAGLTSDPCYNTRPQMETLPGGVYSIAADSRHPSAINLPVLPHEHFPTAASTVTPTSEGVEIPIDWGHPGEPAR